MKAFTFSAISIGVVLAVTPAGAEHSTTRRQIEERSKAVGFTRSHLPVLLRRKGEGNDTIAARAIASLPQTAGLDLVDFRTTTDQAALRLEAANLILRVSDQGNNVRLRDLAPAPEGRDPSAKPSLKAIEDTARNFITTGLQDVVRLGTDDELVFLGTRYAYSAAQVTGAKTSETPKLTGWIASFGRLVGGELVVGGGSSVALFYHSDGTLEGFDVDWPEYDHAGLDVETATVDLTRERAALLNDRPSAQVSSEQRAFACGLYDRGGRSKRERSGIVQPACIDVVVNSSAEETWSIVSTTPGARVPVLDWSWASGTKFCSMAGASCQGLPK